MSRRGFRMSLCAVSTLALMVIVAPSQASGSSGSPAPDGAAQFLAADAGIDTDEAADRLAAQERFNDAGAAAVKTAGQDSFDSWIDQTPAGQTLNVRTQDARVIDIFSARVSAQDGLRIDNASPKVPQLRQALIAMNTDGLPVEMFYAEPRQGQIVAVVQESAAARSDLSASLRSAAQTAGLPTPDIKIEVTSEPMSDDATVYGGSALNGCTAGFTAKRGAELGFVTAAHCGTPKSYWSAATASGSAAGSASRTALFYNSNGDMQFMRMTTNSIANSFYASGAPILRGARLDYTSVGATLCHRGTGSGYHCGNVTSTAAQPNWAGACPSGHCNAAFVSVNAIAAGGDSGGPWFTSNRPMGIHKGGATSGYAVFTWLYYIDGIGVALF